MSEDFQCPYCNAWQEHDFEQNESSLLHQTECEDCGKTFVFTIEYYPHFTVRKADCLNGSEHSYEDKLEDNDYYKNYFSKWLRCRHCEHEIRESKERGDE